MLAAVIITVLAALAWPALWGIACDALSDGSIVVGIRSRPAGFAWHHTYTIHASPVLFSLHVAAYPALAVMLSLFAAVTWLTLLPLAILRLVFVKRLLVIMVFGGAAAGVYWLLVFFGLTLIGLVIAPP